MEGGAAEGGAVLLSQLRKLGPEREGTVKVTGTRPELAVGQCFQAE